MLLDAPATAQQPAVPVTETSVEAIPFTTVVAPGPDGTLQTLKARQIPISDAYRLEVARTGRRILDSEENDMRLFAALSMARSAMGNPQAAEELQAITSSAQLEEYFAKKNAMGNIHDFVDQQIQKSIETGIPYENPLDRETIKTICADAIEQMQSARMIEDAPNIKLEKNDVESRVALIRRLQAEGHEIILTNASPDLRKQLGLSTASEKYQELAKKADAAVAAVDAGLLQEGTLNLSDARQRELLQRQLEGAAMLLKKKRESANPIVRCDRTAEPTNELVYSLSARDFANEMDDKRMGCRRLDLVAPIAPLVADRAIGEVIKGTFAALLFAPCLDALVHPSKLYLYLTGVPHAKMVLFSDVKMFYIALMRFLGSTNMRPSEAELKASRSSSKDQLMKNLAKQGISAVVNTKETPNEQLSVHSKERIVATQRAAGAEATMAFSQKIRDLFSKAPQPSGNANVDEEVSRALLAKVHEAARIYCVETLQAYEIALLLYYEEFIPAQYRADLLTPVEEACEHCAPQDAKQHIAARRAWINGFRAKMILVKEQDFTRSFQIEHVKQPADNEDRVDQMRSWSPTHREMWDFVRFFSLKINKKDLEDLEESAQRWSTKYVNKMSANNE